MFEPYMKSFYVRSTDPTHIKTLKVAQHANGAVVTTTVQFEITILKPVFFPPQLEILTNLANEANISTILREFQVCFRFINVFYSYFV